MYKILNNQEIRKEARTLVDKVTYKQQKDSGKSIQS